MKRLPVFGSLSRKLFLTAVVSSTLTAIAYGQSVKETQQDLSKPAKKGMLTNASLKDDGDIVLTYTMKVDKKSDQLAYEDYVFDSDLKFKAIQPGKENKEMNPDKKVTTLAAYAGGSNSFNVNSQKLALQKEEWTKTWSYKWQRYEWGRRLSKEKVSLKNADSKYDGYTELSTDDGAFIIASYEPDGKGAKEQFIALAVDVNLNVKETPVTTDGNYSLVFYGLRESGNPFVIMAPKDKMPDLKKYVYAEFTQKAELVKRTTINAPSTNMMVMDFREINGELFLVGASTKSDDPYEDEYTDYANISNPAAGISRQVQKYNEVIYKKEMDNFHFLKLKDGELVFATTTPVKNFKDKVIAPPSQKKKHIYQGNKLYIQTMAVTPGGEYFIAGQLMDKDMVKGNLVVKYKDIVGFYFGTNGELKAQYAVEKMNDDSKSEVFESEQRFIMSPDGKTAHWEILEVKGTKGYASFLDAYNGNSTWMGHYFPRIAKINFGSGTLSDFTVMGEKGKFLLYKYHAYLLDEKTKTRFYVGHDDDYEKIWLGKYKYE
jgi:hypothetical protein